MKIDILEKPGGHGQDNREIEITLNEKPVRLVGREHTGREIKDAAIAQGVNIQPNFVLSIERGRGKTEVVGDTDTVKLHPNERFVAIADDDNS